MVVDAHCSMFTHICCCSWWCCSSTATALQPTCAQVKSIIIMEWESFGPSNTKLFILGMQIFAVRFFARALLKLADVSGRERKIASVTGDSDNGGGIKDKWMERRSALVAWQMSDWHGKWRYAFHFLTICLPKRGHLFSLVCSFSSASPVLLESMAR